MLPVKSLKETSLRSIRTTVDLFKILIPISILVKILQEGGAISIAADILSPVMSLVGLPGVLAVVWATSMLANIYTAVVVLASISQGLSLTVAQMTVLASMCLIAHTLPVEVAVARRAGVSAWFTLILRIGGAVVFGFLLYHFYSLAGWHTEPASGFLTQPLADPSWRGWVAGEVHRLFLIFITIVVLHFMMDLLKWLGITDFIIRRCRRLLSIFGMSENVGPLVIVGMLLGIVYGGGLIISETQRSAISKKEIFCAMSLLALLHGVIEDTAIMALIGGNLSGTLIGRILFAGIISILIARFIKLMPDRSFELRFFGGKGVGSG
jgi:hypothetical protein